MEGEEGGEQRRAQGRGMIRREAWGRRGSRVGVLDHKHLAENMGHQSAGGSKQPMSRIGGLGQRTPVEISVSSLFQFSSESGSISVCASSVVT